MLEYVHSIYLSEVTIQQHKVIKVLKILGPKIWNALPTEIKRETSLSKFKECVNLWSGPSCKCSLCKPIEIDKTKS